MDWIETARSSDRAVRLWAVALVSVSAIAISEANSPAFIVASALCVLAPPKIPIIQRTLVISLTLSGYWLGPFILLLTGPLALAFCLHVDTAFIFALCVTGIGFRVHQLESIPSPSFLAVHAGSLAALAVPTIVTLIVFGRWFGICGILVSAATLGSILLATVTGAAVWFGPDGLANPFVRLAIGVLPGLLGAWHSHFDSFESSNLLGFYAVPAGLILSLVIPISPIKSVIFDEAHGKWETTKANFTPEKFGRSVNYTYSSLADYARRLIGHEGTLDHEENWRLLPIDTLLVVKMPTKPLSSAFADGISKWVGRGGRLLIILDHTDLYDSTQNATNLLQELGYKVNADAVFDVTGMPNVPATAYGAAVFARIDATGTPFPWLTGSSLQHEPANSLRLATFGPSFAEQGDYSRQNRFGTFSPSIGLRFLEHTAVVGSSFGRGAVVLILDSTPWSNFSIFKEQYRHLFRSIMHSLARPAALAIAGWGSVLVLGLALLCTIFSSPYIFAIAGIALGVTVGAGTQIGISAFDQPVEMRDFKLRVVASEDAHFQFLSQLNAASDRNYSRIISAMGKYGLLPSASEPGAEIPKLAKARKWLLLEPNDSQLPPAIEVLKHLRGGGDLTILFPSDAARRPQVRNWLASLSLFEDRAKGLAIAEDTRAGGLMARRGALLLRDMRIIAKAKSTSLLKEHESDSLLQSFTVRPTTFPRTSGLLTLSFSSEQFTDEAIGDVWEGVQPSALGRHREAQLAAALLGKEFLPPMPDDAVIVDPTPTELLTTYVVFENGKETLKGKFGGDLPGPSGRIISISEHPQAYLADLRSRALTFVLKHCPKAGEVCPSRLIGPDMIEWLVKWSASKTGYPSAIELVHERRFSGLGSTWNVLFGE